MAVLNIDPPNERQKLFFECQSRYVAYGGARGGGKSWAVRVKAILLCLQYYGIKVLILRRSYPELKDNHIMPMQSMLKGIAKWKETDKMFYFPNNSIIRFGYCDSEADVLQYQGQEYDVLFLDEATQFTEFQFNALKSCVRGANNFPKRIYLTCNPGNVGHEWVKRLFVDKQYKANENPDDYSFIPAKVYDNQALLDSDPGYVAVLESLPEGLKRAWLEGDWNVFEGQYFPEYKENVHIVQPFMIPKHWRKYRAIDYGLDMLACLWIAVDEHRRAVVYRELYEANLIVSEAAEKIRSLTNEDEFIYLTLAPPDLWSRRQETGRSVADIFSEQGISLSKTSNDRIAGWMAMKEYFNPIKNEFGELEPKLKAFSTCFNLNRTIPMLRHDEKKVNDISTEPHEITHAPDALRCFCVYWATGAETPAGEKKRYTPDMLEDYENASEQERAYLKKKWGDPA